MTTLPLPPKKPTQEDLDRVYSFAQSLQQSQPDIPIVLDSFGPLRMDRDLVDACLADLQKLRKVTAWSLFAPLLRIND
jgi:hypothetical protein